MLSLFRKNIFANNLFLLFYALLLQSISGFSLLSGLFIFAQALLMNYISSKNKLEATTTLFPGMLYILFCNLYPGFATISSPLIGNFFILAGLLNTFDYYQGRQLESKCFNAGFFFSIAFLVQPSYGILLLFPFVALFSYRKTSFREILQILTGHLTPFLLYYAYQWLRFDILPDELPLLQTQESQPLAFFEKTTLLIFLFLAFFSTLLVRPFLLSHTSIHARNKTQSLYYLSLLGAISLLFYGLSPITHVLVLWIPLGLFFSHFFSYLRSIFAEVLHLFLLLLLIFLHYFPVGTLG